MIDLLMIYAAACGTITIFVLITPWCQAPHFKFVPKDFWIGLYVNTERHNPLTWYVRTSRTYYLCFIPCFPLIWTTEKTKSIH